MKRTGLNETREEENMRLKKYRFNLFHFNVNNNFIWYYSVFSSVYVEMLFCIRT